MYSPLALLSTLALCNSITVRDKVRDRGDVTIIKEELPPVFISCGLNDIAIISAPVVNCAEVAYHLYKPTGDAFYLDLPKPNRTKFRDQYGTNSTNIITQNINEYVEAIYSKSHFKVLSPLMKEKIKHDNEIDIVKNAEKGMVEYDFMIGPLLEEDHGNWVLSAYCVDEGKNWIDIFQVISLSIVASVPMTQDEVALKEGSTFNLSFAYSIKGIEACSLQPPESTLDRYYDRNRLLKPDKCGYVVPNVTTQDAGVWKVTGVGRIIYEGFVILS